MVKQVGFIAGKDIKLAGKEGDKDTRLSNHDKRKTKSDAQKRKLSAVVTGDEFDDGKDPEDKDEDPEVIYKQAKKKRKVILEIDPNEIVKQTASTTDRLGSGYVCEADSHDPGLWCEGWWWGPQPSQGVQVRRAPAKKEG